MRTTPDILFKTLGDPTRRALFETVHALTHRSGVSQPAMSKHLSVLKVADLVRDRREGRETRYRAEPQVLAPLIDWMSLAPAFGPSCCQAFRELHRSKIPNLDTNVKLARQPLQAAVTMAVEVGPTFAHIPPGAEGIVAHNEVHAIDTDLGICLDAFPGIAVIDRGILIVPFDKVFAAMQRL
jgi:hypothetical protein